ncbi:MAG: rod-binding protein [Alphaproteobacteria bacterium]|nr:rod-binding protein [Alphaproteobacteria bacterium]
MDMSLALPVQADLQSAQAKSLERAGSFKPAPGMTHEDIRKKATEFEAVFISQMLAPMFQGADGSEGFFGGGHAEKMYQSMMIEEIGKEMASGGGIGIADQVARQLIQMQEADQ